MKNEMNLTQLEETLLNAFIDHLYAEEGFSDVEANDLAKFRADLGLTEGITFTNNNNMLPAGGGVLKPAFNPMKAQQDALTQRLEKTERSEATLTVVAPKGTVDWKADKNFPIITSTMRGN